MSRPHALLLAVLLASPVFGLGLFAHGYLTEHLQTEADLRTRAGAAGLRAGFEAEQRSLGRSLAAICARDVGIERVLLTEGPAVEGEAALIAALEDGRPAVAARAVAAPIPLDAPVMKRVLGI